MLDSGPRVIEKDQTYYQYEELDWKSSKSVAFNLSQVTLGRKASQQRIILLIEI